jgi:hypothetical protein
MLLAGTLSSCYTYRPLPGPDPVVGSRVSARLTDDGIHEMEATLGPDVAEVEGDLLEVDSTGLRLAVTQVQDRRGVQSDWRRETIDLPRRTVANLAVRQLSKGGTVLLGGAAVGGFVALYSLLGGPGIFEGNGGSGGGGKD